MSKYIDLGPQIAKGTGGLSLTSVAHEHQLKALKWLDENPDQVPGRTITESLMDHYLSGETLDWRWGFCTALSLLEVKTVSDPKPTNAEKLADDIREVDGGHNLGAGVLAERLASLGWTKAPDADDE